MTTKTAIHPSGLKLSFSEADHRYLDEKGHEYTSVTTLVKRYCEPFDSPAIALAKATRDLGPESTRDQIAAQAKALQAEWAKAGETASRYGTRVHETAEAILLGNQPPHKPESETERLAFSAVWAWIAGVKGQFDILKPEMMLFSPSTLVAGTADLVGYSLARKTLFVLDWKTNKEIRVEGYRGKCMLPPAETVQDCEIGKYSLQLQLYAWMLKREGYCRFLPGPVERLDLGILHVVPEKGVVEEITALDVKSEMLEVLLNHCTEVPF